MKFVLTLSQAGAKVSLLKEEPPTQVEQQLRLLKMLGEAATAIEEVESYQFDYEDDPWPSG